MISNIFIPSLTTENIITEKTIILTGTLINNTSPINLVGNTSTYAATQIAFNDPSTSTTAWQIGPNFTEGIAYGTGTYDFLFDNPQLLLNQIIIHHDTLQITINSTLTVNGYTTSYNLTSLTEYSAEVTGDGTGTITNYYQIIGNFAFYYITPTSLVYNTGEVYIHIPSAIISTYSCSSTVIVSPSSLSEVYYGGGDDYLTIYSYNLSSGQSYTYNSFVFIYLL